MNKIMLMGRLTKDPEVRYSKGEKQMAIARYTLAVDRKQKREDGVKADFFQIVAFDRQGEFAERYLRKGIKIVISGRVQTGYYDNRDGVTMPFFEISCGTPTSRIFCMRALTRRRSSISPDMRTARRRWISMRR